MAILIKNSHIVTEKEIIQGDLLFDEKIIAIGSDISAEAEEILENYVVLPGGVDIHTHMTLDVGFAQVVDDFVTGGQAALAGGTTTLVDHVGFAAENAPLSASPKAYIEKNAHKTAIDFGVHGVFQHFHQDTLGEMESLAKEGITSFKIYLTYDYRLTDQAIVEILKKTKELGVLPIFHAEQHEMIEELRQKYQEEGKLTAKYHALSRPVESEVLAIGKLIALAKEAGNAPIYIAHLSSKAGLEEIIRGKLAGNPHIYAETCPQYLYLTQEKLDDPVEGLKYILSPPLRQAEDQQALWLGLAQGHIQTVATDHCPFDFHGAKQLGVDDFTKCPNGAPGVGERMPLLFYSAMVEKRLNLLELAQVSATNPAKFAGLYPKKGALQVSADSDLLLMSPSGVGKISTQGLFGMADYSAYEGLPCGEVARVYQRGQLRYADGKCVADGHSGMYLPRKSFQFP